PTARVASNRGARKQHRTCELADTNAHERRRLTPGAENDAVPVGKKRTPLAAGKRDGSLAAGRQLQQRARLLGGGAGLRAATEEIPRLQVAAIDRVVRDHLRDTPVGMAERRTRQALGAERCGAHARRVEPRFELDIDCPAVAQPAAIEIRQRLRIARSEEHTSELQSRENLVCRLLLEKKKTHPNGLRFFIVLTKNFLSYIVC